MEQTAQESQPKALSEEAKERRYVKVKKILDSMGCIEQYELRIHVYQVVLRRLSRILDYKDCKERYNECKAQLEQYREDGKEEIYQNMLKKKEAAVTVDDIHFVVKEAERIVGYKDADEIVIWAKNAKAEIYKKEKIQGIIRFGIFIGIIAVVLLYCLYRKGILTLF